MHSYKKKNNRIREISFTWNFRLSFWAISFPFFIQPLTLKQKIQILTQKKSLVVSTCLNCYNCQVSLFNLTLKLNFEYEKFRYNKSPKFELERAIFFLDLAKTFSGL